MCRSHPWRFGAVPRLVFRGQKQEQAENIHKLAVVARQGAAISSRRRHEAASDGICTNLEERELSTKKQSHDEASDSLAPSLE